MTDAIDAIVEIFTWIGFGAGFVLAVIALILYLSDGTWVPARAMIEDLGDRRVARWFDADGGVGEAQLSSADEQTLAGLDAAEVFVRRGSLDRMRLTPRSPAVRATFLLACGLLAVGAVSLAISLVMLFSAG